MMEWGEFLPQPIRQMLLNMSRFMFRNVFAEDSIDPVIENEKFFFAFKIMMDQLKKEELYKTECPLEVHWHFL